MNKELSIVFMGTPEFAVASLDNIINNGYNVVGVITAPDKPAGRGKKTRLSAVKEYALKHNLHILQPTNLKNEGFIRQLKALNANLQIVVAFRMLPEIVWTMPKLGTFNLHASLLPNYRGAAPINWAIINGEKETGVTTFFLDHKIDTGKIILSEKTTIEPDENAGQLHDKLMVIGAELVIKTIKAINSKNLNLIDQTKFTDKNKSYPIAPKINKKDCSIKWPDSVQSIHNIVRGLSPYPAAYTKMRSLDGSSHYLKIFKTTYDFTDHDLKPGQVLTDGKKSLQVAAKNGFIKLEEVQISGKKKIKTEDFLRGFKINNRWRMFL